MLKDYNKKGSWLTVNNQKANKSMYSLSQNNKMNNNNNKHNNKIIARLHYNAKNTNQFSQVTNF